MCHRCTTYQLHLPLESHIGDLQRHSPGKCQELSRQFTSLIDYAREHRHNPTNAGELARLPCDIGQLRQMEKSATCDKLGTGGLGWILVWRSAYSTTTMHRSFQSCEPQVRALLFLWRPLPAFKGQSHANVHRHIIMGGRWGQEQKGGTQRGGWVAGCWWTPARAWTIKAEKKKTKNSWINKKKTCSRKLAEKLLKPHKNCGGNYFPNSRKLAEN